MRRRKQSFALRRRSEDLLKSRERTLDFLFSKQKIDMEICIYLHFQISL